MNYDKLNIYQNIYENVFFLCSYFDSRSWSGCLLPLLLLLLFRFVFFSSLFMHVIRKILMKCFFSVAEWWQKNGTSEAHDEIVDCLVNHCAASGKNYESEISVSNEEREKKKHLEIIYWDILPCYF